MNIVPEKTNLKAFFSAEDRRYHIPVYQRDYSWKLDHVNQLWEDILISWKSESDYFMGPFVLNSEDHTGDRFDIVDGQQRLATFTILFSAIRQYARLYISDPNHKVFENWISSEKNKQASERIADIAGRRIGWQMTQPEYYLQLNLKDDKFFREEIISRGIPPLIPNQCAPKPGDRLLMKAYLTFCSKIHEEFLSAEDGLSKLESFLLHTTTRLWFLKISVATSQDAYLLFEGLNHKGMSLSVADLLKNKFLMTCGSDETKKSLLLEAWDEMAENLEKSRFDLAEFIRTYWSAFHSGAFSPVSKKQLYGEIKKYLSKDNALEFVLLLKKASSYYSQITDKDLIYPSTDFKDKSLECVYAELNTLKYSVCYTLFLAAHTNRPSLLDKLARKVLTFLFRVITIEETAVGRAKSTMSKALDLLLKDRPDDEILACISDVEDTDEYFLEKLSSARIESNYVGRYILTKIHAHYSGPEITIHPDSVHLEHILPIRYETHWADFKVPDGKEIDDYIYSLGNLTLLSGKENQQIQNKSFENKIEFYQSRDKVDAGSPGSSIKTTYDIHDEYNRTKFTWNCERIEMRSVALANICLNIWTHQI